jgi:hypothetical protein
MWWARCLFQATFLEFFMRYRGGGGLGEGIRKDLHGYKRKIVKFGSFDSADVMIIANFLVK